MAKSTAPLNGAAIQKLQKICRHEPAYLATKRFGITFPTLTRAMAGLPLHQATREMIELRLKEMTVGVSAPASEVAA